MGAARGNKTVSQILATRRMFTTGQVARILNASSRTVCKWCDSGRLESHRLPMSEARRIHRESVVKFLRKEGYPIPPELEGDLVFTTLMVGLDSHFLEGLKPTLSRLDSFTPLESSGLLHTGILIGEGHAKCVLVGPSTGRAEIEEIGKTIRNSQNRISQTLLFAIASEEESSLDTFGGGFYDQVWKQPVSVGEVGNAILEWAKLRFRWPIETMALKNEPIL